MARKSANYGSSQQLRPYGIRPRSMRTGQRTGKGYAKEDFKEVFRRYIPRSEAQAYLASMRRAALEPIRPQPPENRRGQSCVI